MISYAVFLKPAGSIEFMLFFFWLKFAGFKKVMSGCRQVEGK